MPRILLVDDDPGIRDLVSDFLGHHGYEVTIAEDGAAMDLAMARADRPFDLVVLDLMMPGEHGLEIARRLSSAPGGPAIIMLSAMGDDSDRIVGLEVGADDYLPKPCNPRELLARIRAVLRRRHDPTEEHASLIAEFAGWRLDMVRRELTSPDGVLVTLSDGEFSLLRVFVERPQQPLAREELLELARKRDTESFDRSIDVQISRLRHKLDSAVQNHEELIRTVRNKGYLFTPTVTRR